LAAICHTDASGRAPTTSGTLPAAAADVISCVNWFSSVATILTLIPLAAVNLSAVACAACTRSVWFSRLQTVSVWSSPPSSPEQATRAEESSSRGTRILDLASGRMACSFVGATGGDGWSVGDITTPLLPNHKT
jgi:hypothetical protein